MTLASPFMTALRGCLACADASAAAAAMAERESTAFARWNRNWGNGPAGRVGRASSGVRQHRQRQLADRVDFVQQLRRHLQATAAGGAATGAHGQLGKRAAAGSRDLADLALGDTIAKADVHGGGSLVRGRIDSGDSRFK